MTRHLARFLIVLTIAQAATSAGAQTPSVQRLRFSEHLIGHRSTYSHQFHVLDLDHDGDPDLLATQHRPTNALVAYWNNGNGRFQQSLLRQNSPRRLARLAIGDVDGDGWEDVVTTGNIDGRMLWFRNTLAAGSGAAWPQFTVAENATGAHDGLLADVDSDLDADLVVWSYDGGHQVAWFENDGTPLDGAWTRHVVDPDIARMRSIEAQDLDSDGDLDLVGTAAYAGRIVWFENSGTPISQPWRKHVIDRSPSPVDGQLADLDGDGDFDLVMALGLVAPPFCENTHQVAWYENPGQPMSRPWTKHIVSPRLFSAVQAVAGDLDGDGDLDVVASSWALPGQIVWFENRGAPKGYWPRHVVKTAWKNAGYVRIADFNGDGRPDIVAVSQGSTDELRWWENEGTRATADGPR